MPSVLPLHLCEVLEEEYVSLHGPLGKYPDWAFTADQITDPDRLGKVLAASADPAGAVAPTEEFTRHVVARLRHLRHDGAWQGTVTAAALLPALNALLDDPGLYVVAAELLQLRSETTELAQGRFDGRIVLLDGDELRRFNRLLLEDAYPGAFKQIYGVRLDAITRRIHEVPRAALCLSGGGIRSGTFSLGVLQGLAQRKLLKHFQYLSTVSGGGYIGAWFTAWCHRHPEGLDGVVAALSTHPERPKLEPEPEPLKHLRDFSNFVAPRPSLISADVWSFLAIYLRNLLINWIALIPILLAALMAPRIVVALLYAGGGTERAIPGGVVWTLLGLGALCSVIAVLYVTVNRPSRADALTSRPWLRRRTTQGSFLRYSLIPTIVAGVCFSTVWAWYKRAAFDTDSFLAWFPTWSGDGSIPALALAVVFLGIAVYMFALLLASVILKRQPQVSDFWAALLTGAAGGLLTWWLLEKVFPNPAPGPDPLAVAPALYATLAVPAYLLIFFAAATVFTAVTSRRWAVKRSDQMFSIEDEDREWLGRYAGWLLIAALAWTAGSALVIFGPMLLLESPRVFTALGGITGVAAFLGGRSARTSASDERKGTTDWKAVVLENGLSIAALLFLVVMVAALSLLTGWLITKLTSIAPSTSLYDLWLFPRVGPPGEIGPFRGRLVPSGFNAVWADQLTVLYRAPLLLLVALAAGAFLVGYGAARLVINLNKFSLHAAYRARIIRAFLGASRSSAERTPNPFTGFDPQDNIQVHELRRGLLREASFKPGGMIRLAGRLQEGRDPESKALRERLSSATQKLLRMYQKSNPLSPTLKRKLLEDLNRLLDADPGFGLHTIEPFASRPASEHTRTLLRAAWPSIEIPDTVTPNSALAELLPRQGRVDAVLILNRSILDDAYQEDIEELRSPPPPYRLMHVVGAALNLVRGKRLAWQQRRAESFTFSALHSGSLFRGYRRSRQYGGPDGVSLGTAVTISGAAVSSNMGYHSSSAAVTFILTLFNARLGWWLGNPGPAGSDRRGRAKEDGTYRRAFPRSSIGPIALEAFGLTDDQSRYVLLSDGGHFDNLGIYEMVLRRCRLIVAVDGSQDAKCKFDDLGAAIRKIRIDLGIHIEFKGPMEIYPNGHPRAADGRYWAVAEIRYADVDDGAPAGMLLYIKPALRGTEPRDVLQYAAANPAFPHQPTTDQLFDESQFESYRMLGRHAVESLVGTAPASMSLRDLIEALHREYSFPGSVSPQAPASSPEPPAWLAAIHERL